jgi:hypothetical protein
MRKSVMIIMVLTIFGAGKIYAQITPPGSVLTDIKGSNVKEADADVQGTPYLFDDWLPGSVVTEDGKTYDNLKLRYNIRFSQLIFLNQNDEVLGFREPVKMFTINHMVFANGFPPVDTQTIAAFYQVLADGKIKLLKYSKKVIEERQTYGATAMEKSYRKMQSYYIFKDGKMVKVRADKKSLLAALPDHSAQLESYIKDNNVNLKDDMAIAQVIVYYNTL